ncbi:MAG: cell wall-binding repeat-containing protein, partial [Clostridia bacterium]|nr:cell wall-binding repeat-containing protein [Clostridia bacterium]
AGTDPIDTENTGTETAEDEITEDAVTEDDTSADEAVTDDAAGGEEEHADEAVEDDGEAEEAAEEAAEETAEEPADAIPAEEALPEETDPAAASGTSPMTVSATANGLSIHIDPVGSSGTAQLYMYEACQYHPSDPMKGLSTNTSSQGYLVGTYTCGNSSNFSIGPTTNGTDNFFKKFYLVQGSTILAGPVYANKIESKRSVAEFPRRSIKGIINESRDGLAKAKDLGVSSVAMNVDINSLILRNEDENGNRISYSGRSDVIPFVSNGETFYFNVDKVNSMDSTVSGYSKNNINVTMLVISFASTVKWDSYPSSLAYTKVNNYTLGFNTSNTRGMKYFTAVMEFLGDRYSKSKDTGIVNKFVIGNEIDFAYDWCLITDKFDSNGKFVRTSLDVFMEEYARGLRLANNAVKKYNDQARVYISVTHNWAAAKWESCQNPIGPENRFYNSYAPKAMLDWLSTNEKARGDYNWGACMHPYPIESTSPNPFYDDLHPGKLNDRYGYFKPATGNWKTSPFVTSINLEIYQQYFEQAANKYNGSTMRDVILPEANICSAWQEDVSSSEYTRSLYQQAASCAAFYYRAANLSCISEMDWYRPTDYDGLRSGFIDMNGNRKPSYDVWKFIDTDATYIFANKYLSYISNVSSYRDLMNWTNSGYDWGSKWKDSNIIKVNVTSSLNRLAGSNRYATSFMIADQMLKSSGKSSFDTIVIASGKNYPDALSGTYLADVRKAPIILTGNTDANIAEIAAYVKKNLTSGGKVYLLGGEGAVSKAMENALSGLNVERLGGSNRYQTNISILNAASVPQGSEILVCTGKGFADSLSVSPTGKPILLVGNTLTADQKAYLAKLSGCKFTMIGGAGAVSDAIGNELKAYGSVRRVAGSNRYATSVAVAKEYFSNPTTMVFAYALNFPDGLCAGSFANLLGTPVILVANGKADNVRDYFNDLTVRKCYIIGGQTLIGDDTALSLIY